MLDATHEPSRHEGEPHHSVLETFPRIAQNANLWFRQILI